MELNTELEEWQEWLLLHFKTVKDRRRTRGIAEPLFALEHGLAQTEVSDLERAVRTHIASRAPLRDHWLVWVVYSAEIGYRYSGDEYWQTFEQETPGWRRNGDRYRIRDFYKRFAREFDGAVPSGPWAEHFTIICWPITHAILPKDLQVQLARILFESRFRFTEDVLGSPDLLGNLIATRSLNASSSSRFMNLVQDKRLLGQIAAALLIQGQTGTSELIFPSTLQRISEDLDRERQAREWLQKARRSANERVQIHGLGSLSSQTSPTYVSKLDDARVAAAVLGIEPRLILRPRDVSNGSWDMLLEIPDLSNLMLRFPTSLKILTDSRCVVAGSQGRPLARGRLVYYGAQRVRLVRWPNPDEVLLQFEKKDPQLEFLLRTECLLRPGSTWLLRIASDGLAYERRGLRVRPGESYIILSTGGPIDGGGHAAPIDIECEGVHGAILNLPESMGKDRQQSIQNLGLGQARAIKVWPAGLSAVTWDGEGHGEWLASERPCLAILADHPLESLKITIDSSLLHVFELTSLDAGEPLFLELPQLSVGIHRLRFSANSNLADETEALDDQEAIIRILEDKSHTSIFDHRSPLSVQIDPPQPTIEQLWDGKVEILVRGPLNRKIVCCVSLLEGIDGTEILLKNLPPVTLPVSPDEWRIYFNRYFRKRDDVQEAYDRAKVCVIDFGAGELGNFTLRCERPFTPLRWILSRNGKNFMARLYNDSGDSENPTISVAAFETPCDEEEIAFATEIQVPDHGGMYTARTQSHTASIIVPPVPLPGFAVLDFNPEVVRQVRSPNSAMRIIIASAVWSRAKLPGNPLSALRLLKIMDALVFELFRLVCGDNWSKAEEKADSSGRDTSSLKILASAITRDPAETGLGTALQRDAELIASYDCDRRVDYLASLATAHRLLPDRIQRMATGQAGPTGLGSPLWLTELALRLASDPASAEIWAGSDLRSGLNHLMEFPSLAKAARFAVLATQPFFSSGRQSGDLNAGWRWV